MWRLPLHELASPHAWENLKDMWEFPMLCDDADNVIVLLHCKSKAPISYNPAYNPRITPYNPFVWQYFEFLWVLPWPPTPEGNWMNCSPSPIKMLGPKQLWARFGPRNLKIDATFCFFGPAWAPGIENWSQVLFPRTFSKNKKRSGKIDLADLANLAQVSYKSFITQVLTWYITWLIRHRKSFHMLIKSTYKCYRTYKSDKPARAS